MNTEEKTPKSEELGATPAEVEQENSEPTPQERAVEGLAPQDEEEEPEVEKEEEESKEEESEEKKEEEEESKEEEDKEDKEEEEEDKEKEEEKPKEEEITNEAFVEEAKKLFPGEEFKTEADLYKRMIQDKKDNDESNRRVLEVLLEQPEIGEIIKDVANGASFEEALAIHVDIEALKPLKKEDRDNEAWAKAKKEREKKLKEIKDYEAQVNDNIVKSGEVLEKFRKDKEMSQEEINKFATASHEIIKDIQLGLVTEKFLDFMYKNLSWEDALKEAREQGEIRGQNKKIVADKAKKSGGDGLPRVTSKGQPEAPKPKDPVAQAFVQHQKRRNRF